MRYGFLAPIGGVALALVLASPQFQVSVKSPASAEAQSCPNLSQASLDIETGACPSTFGAPVIEKRYNWSLQKTRNQDSLTDPNVTNYGFTVKVTENAAVRKVVLTGTLKITNSGELNATLWSIVANLQTKTAGNKYQTVQSAVQTESPSCAGQGRTCLGTFNSSAGAQLVLLDPNSNDVISLTGLAPVPPSETDNDGDGKVNEDPVDQTDNDGDGLIDEDPACDAPTIINYIAEFDVPATSQLRLEMLVTFGSAGKRGSSPNSVSCSLDVNCNGSIDGDNTATCNVNESENNNIRTVPTRNSFQLPTTDTELCKCTNLADLGAVSSSTSCVSITTNSLSQGICATGTAGNMSSFTIGGDASCVDASCTSNINNTATLECVGAGSINPTVSLVSGSPALATIPASCSGGGPPPPPPTIGAGSFCTFTKGGWGQGCNGNNKGCFRDQHFSSLFSVGAFIGDGVTWTSGGNEGTNGCSAPGSPYGTSSADCSTTQYRAVWTSAAAVDGYLPSGDGGGGTPAALTADQDNPTSTTAGNLGHQLLAATLNVKANLAGELVGTVTTTKLADLKFAASCVASGLAGKTVREVLHDANVVVSGGTSAIDCDASTGGVQPCTYSQLNNALTKVNEAFPVETLVPGADGKLECLPSSGSYSGCLVAP